MCVLPATPVSRWLAAVLANPESLESHELRLHLAIPDDVLAWIDRYIASRKRAAQKGAGRFGLGMWFVALVQTVLCRDCPSPPCAFSASLFLRLHYSRESPSPPPLPNLPSLLARAALLQARPHIHTCVPPPRSEA